MKIFITGGSGFIGRHVLRELLERKHQVLVLVQGKMAQDLNSKGVKFIVGDLSDTSRWMAKVSNFAPDAALHLAWEGLPDYGAEVSIRNLHQGLNLFQELVKLKCKKIVVSGSCWEYGASSGRLNEEAGLHSTSAFSAAKTALYWMGCEMAKEYGMEFIWTRIFYVYGPGQRSSSLVPHLIKCKISGKRPKITNLRGGNDFIYVEDVARALRMLLEKKTNYNLYNIGSGKLTSINEIVGEIYGKSFNKKPRKIAGFYADISRIKKEIGWRPRIGIDQGLKKTLSYY